MNARQKTVGFKFNKVWGFIAEIMLPYHWAYRTGVADGFKKSNYYKGYADGQEDGMKFVIDSQRKFFDNKDLRKRGY